MGHVTGSLALPVDLEQARLAIEFRHGMLLVRVQGEAGP